MLSSGHGRPPPHSSPASCELSCPVLQVRKLKRGRASPRAAGRGTAQPGPRIPPADVKAHMAPQRAFLSGQLLPTRSRAPLCGIPSMWLLVCLLGPPRFSALALLPLPQDSPAESDGVLPGPPPGGAPSSRDLAPFLPDHHLCPCPSLMGPSWAEPGVEPRSGEVRQDRAGR